MLILQKEQELQIPTCSSRGVKGKGSIVSCKEPRVPRKLQLPVVDGLIARISKRCACILPEELEQLEVEEYDGYVLTRGLIQFKSTLVADDVSEASSFVFSFPPHPLPATLFG